MLEKIGAKSILLLENWLCMICTLSSTQLTEGSKAYYPTEQCYDSMEWLRYTSVHHQMLCESVKCSVFISYEEKRYTKIVIIIIIVKA